MLESNQQLHRFVIVDVFPLPNSADHFVVDEFVNFILSSVAIHEGRGAAGNHVKEGGICFTYSCHGVIFPMVRDTNSHLLFSNFLFFTFSKGREGSG